MKKIALCILTIFIFFSLYSCKTIVSKISDSTPTPKHTVQTEPTGTPFATSTVHPDLLITGDDLKDERVVFWHPFTGEARVIMQSLVNEFNQSNEWGIFIEIHDFTGFDLIKEEILNAANRIEMPDVITAPPEFLVGQSNSPTPIIPLDHYVESILFGIKDEADYFSAVWNGDVDGGIRYGLPAYRSAQVMFYNQSLAGELGFDSYPTNLDEWKNQACTAALFNNSDSNKSNDGTGGWIVDLAPETWYSWITAFQNDQSNQDSQFLFSTPANELALQFIRATSDDGCTWFAREQKPQDYLRDGFALFYSAPIEKIINQEYSITKTSSTNQWQVFPFPGLITNSKLIVSGYSYGIYQSSPRKQMASWLFIRWLQDPERLARIVKASASIPLKKAELELLANFGVEHPQWLSIIESLDNALPTPSDPDWEISQLVLQDAAWQSLQANTTINQVPELLRQADEAVADIKAQINKQ